MRCVKRVLGRRGGVVGSLTLLWSAVGGAGVSLFGAALRRFLKGHKGIAWGDKLGACVNEAFPVWRGLNSQWTVVDEASLCAKAASAVALGAAHRHRRVLVAQRRTCKCSDYAAVQML